MKKIDLIVDLQYGSTGKGLIAGFLAKIGEYDTCVTANMPNAGHTFIDKNGRKWVHKVLPNGIVGGNMKNVMIAPGAVFDTARLLTEIGDSSDLMSRLNLMIHPNAGVLTDEHRDFEQRLNSISSTMQGSAAALMQKMQRDPSVNSILARDALKGTSLERFVTTEEKWRDTLRRSKGILAEGAQGYSLGLNTHFWPYTTSRDCTPARFMADMALPLNMLNRVIGTARTYPIRVGNTEGGTSGPHYPDQSESSWESLGIAPELTTVTQRERRVFTFSQLQLDESCFYAAPDMVFLNFCNYCTPSRVSDIVACIERSCRKEGVVKFFGYGATESDIR